MNELAKPLTEIVSGNVEQLIDKSIEGQEQAFQDLLRLALKATTSADWTDMGGNPYLQASGSKKIALRFGCSVEFDRSEKGEVNFGREDFNDEQGTFYVYTVTGKARIGTRIFEAIGTASTRDEFLGWSGKGENRKLIALHESLQDAKKKAVTNFYGNAIKAILGISGFTWDDLGKFGIGRGGKATVNFGSSKGAKTALPPLPKRQEKAPYWASDYNENRYINVKIGSHFSVDFCKANGMKETKTQGTYFAKWTDTLWSEVEAKFSEVEALKEPGEEG